MLKTCPRSPQSFKSCQHWQVLFPSPEDVGIEEPLSGHVVKVTHFVKKEPLPIDPHLKVSDFSLSSQLAAGMNLRDCGTYIHCTSPEEFDYYLRDHAVALAAFESSKVKEPVVDLNVSEPSNVEPNN